MLLERGAQFLKLVYDSPRWRIWEVAGPTRRPRTARRCSPPARTGSRSTRAKPTVVRYRYTPYWSTTRRVRAPRARAAGRGSTPTSSGVVLVQARFGLERRSDRGCKQQLSAGVKPSKPVAPPQTPARRV